jgi:hypothetical protein
VQFLHHIIEARSYRVAATSGFLDTKEKRAINFNSKFDLFYIMLQQVGMNIVSGQKALAANK